MRDRNTHPHPHVSPRDFLAAGLVALALHAVWQGHGLLDPAFRNPDVAGIAYNARILATGGLPYVDSVEIKPPGAFFLFAPLLELGGMRAVWGAAVLWGALLSLATGVLAALVWGRAAGPRTVIVHAACAAIASDGDINYSFWMATPFALSAACACGAVLSPRYGASVRLWAVAGALALLAAAIKPSAWPVALVFAALIARELHARRTKRAVAAVLAGSAGAAAVATALALPYLAAGRLDALVAGLNDVARFGNEYVAAVRDPAGGRLSAVLGGLPCLAEQMPGPLLLSLAGLANLFPRNAARTPLGFVAGVFLVAALSGVMFTLRFFSHDNAQLWPALAVIATRPAGLLARALDALELRVAGATVPSPLWRRAITPLVTLAVGACAAFPGFDFRWGYVHFMAERDHQVKEICTELSARLPAGDPVLAWGWSAWSVYEHCARRAPGPVFKVIASVTTVNTNTCNNGYGPMRLRRDGGPAAFLGDVRHKPPSLVLWSTYFKEMGGDPLDDWAELKAFVAERYTVVDARGPFVALLRRDLVEAHALAPDAPAHGSPPSPEPGGSGRYGWSGRAGSVWTSTSFTPENSRLMASMTQCVTR